MALMRESLTALGLTEAQIEGVMELYRLDAEERARAEGVRSAYRALLEAERIDPRRVDAIMRVTPLDELRLTEDGALEDAEALARQIRRDWADFVMTEERRPAAVQMPPVGGTRRLSRGEILAMRDAAQRQRAIAENHELFGF